MKGIGLKSVLAAVLLLGFAAAAEASPIITLLGDTGTSRVTTYGASNEVTGLSANTLTNPYGVPPGPTAVALPGGNGWTITLPITNDFMAFANNTPTGKSVVMDGKLDFYFDINGPALPLTFNILEDGTMSTSGNGQASMTGGIVVSGLNGSLIAVETRSKSFANPTIVGNTWSIVDQVGGFTGSYTRYKIAVDNTLLASALTSNVASAALVDKDHFKLIITTDGSGGGGVPEPASLGVLAVGGLALLVRRRRA